MSPRGQTQAVHQNWEGPLKEYVSCVMLSNFICVKWTKIMHLDLAVVATECKLNRIFLAGGAKVQFCNSFWNIHKSLNDGYSSSLQLMRHCRKNNHPEDPLWTSKEAFMQDKSWQSFPVNLMMSLVSLGDFPALTNSTIQVWIYPEFRASPCLLGAFKESELNMQGAKFP